MTETRAIAHLPTLDIEFVRGAARRRRRANRGPHDCQALVRSVRRSAPPTAACHDGDEPCVLLVRCLAPGCKALAPPPCRRPATTPVPRSAAKFRRHTSAPAGRAFFSHHLELMIYPAVRLSGGLPRWRRRAAPRRRRRLAPKFARKPCVVRSPVPQLRYENHDVAQRLSYSSWRRHHNSSPSSFLPHGARSRNW